MPSTKKDCGAAQRARPRLRQVLATSVPFYWQSSPAPLVAAARPSAAGGGDKGAARRRHRPAEEPRRDRLVRRRSRGRRRRRRSRHGRVGKVLLGWIASINALDRTWKKQGSQGL